MPRRCFRLKTAAAISAFLFVLLFANGAEGQNAQFLFDPNGNFLSLLAETAALPQILGQPQMQVVIPGNHASFSVSVADTSGVSYQWFFNSTAIPGATADSLLLITVNSANQGPYWVAVSNSFGSVTSVLANLYIDSRGCGMPDSWQLEYFGNTNQAATGDFDGDGVSNLQEFLDGTNPANAASALYRISLVNDGGTVMISPDQPTYANGQIVTLVATSTNSNAFHAWTGGVVTRDNSITVTMTNNMTLFAHFLPFTLVWTNLQGGDWNVAANWSPNLAPGSNESVIIGGGSSASSSTITENSNVDLVDFTFGSSTFIPVLTGSGRITIAGTGIWNTGTMSGTGSIVVLPGASLSLPNSPGIGLVFNRTLENAGSVVWGGGNLQLGGVITNDAGAQFEIGNPASFIGGGTPRFDNAGTLTLAEDAATTFNGVAFNDYGTVDFPGGTLTLSGGGVLAGPLVVPAGSALQLQGGTYTSTTNLSITGGGTLLVSAPTSATLSGTINVTGSNIFSGGSVDFTGNYTRTNTMTISGATASFDGTGTVSPSTLTLSGGTLGGAQTVTIRNSMSWSGGSMSGTGRTLIPSGASLTVSNLYYSFNSMTSRTLDNGGTTTWAGASITMNGGVITNEPGALFQVQSPASFNGGGLERFDNAGTLLTMGSGTNAFAGVALNNFNLVEIQGGTLALQGGNNAGTISVPAGTVLNYAGGTFTTSGNPSVSGAGTLLVSGVTSATLGGTINVTGSNIFSNGSVDFTGNYTCTNTMVISGSTASFDGTGTVSPSILNLSGGTLGGAQTVTARNSMSWSGGSMSGTGRTLIPSGASLTVINLYYSFNSMTSRTLDNGGTTTWAGASITMIGGVITNEPGALFQVQSPASFTGGGSERFDNAGTLLTMGSGTNAFAGVALNNFNLIEVQGSTLALRGGGNNAGTISVPAGTVLNYAGGTFTTSGNPSVSGAGMLLVSSSTSATLGGTVNVSGSNIFSGGSVDFTGNYTCTNTMVISGGTASFDGTGTVSPSTLTLSGGTLGGAQTVTARNSMSWSGGSMSGTGRTLIPSGASLAVSNLYYSFNSMTSRTLDNGGTTTWAGASITMNGGVITNEPGALFQVQSPASFNGDGLERFDNAGTFRKSVTPGTFTFSAIPLNNNGTVDIETGTLFANGGGYTSFSNAVLNCALAGTTPGTNYGQLQVGGSVTLNGTLSVNLTNNYIPTTNDLFTLVTAGTRNGAFSNFIYPSNKVAMVLSNTPTSVIVRATNILAVPEPFLFPPQLSGSNIVLTWTTYSNATYRVQFNPNLSPSNWFALPGDVTALSNTATKLDTLTSSNRYYRVLGFPP